MEIQSLFVLLFLPLLTKSVVFYYYYADRKLIQNDARGNAANYHEIWLHSPRCYLELPLLHLHDIIHNITQIMHRSYYHGKKQTISTKTFCFFLSVQKENTEGKLGLRFKTASVLYIENLSIDLLCYVAQFQSMGTPYSDKCFDLPARAHHE